jgi:hypothetical protein
MDKKVVLVGSAGYLNKANLGSYIDTFDVIWRTNFTGHPMTIKHYPEIVGSRYGNWFIHAIPWSGFKFSNNKFVNKFKQVHNYDKILLNGNEIELEQCKILGHHKNVDKNTWMNLYRFVNKSEVFKKQIDNEVKYDKYFKSDFDNIYLTHFRAMEDCYSMMGKRGIKLLKPPVQKPSSGLRILVALLNQYDHIHMVGFDRGISGNFLYHQNIYNKLKSVGVELRSRDNHIITKNENSTGKKKDSKIAKHHLSAEYDFMMKLKEEGRLTFV